MRRTADEAGLDKDSQQQPHTKLTLSSTYNVSDADIELQSKDGTRYLVHRANLGSSSKTFGEMFDSVPAPAEARGIRPVIQLEETATVLDRMLPYCYPQKTPPVDLQPPEAWEGMLPLLACFDKYELWRGIEAVCAELTRAVAIDLKRVSVHYWPSLPECFRAYAFARHFDFKPLVKSAKLGMLEAATTCSEIEKALYDVPLGVLGASVGVERVALRLYAHLHASNRLHNRYNDSYNLCLDDHSHPERMRRETRRDAWDPLFECTTVKGVQTRIRVVDCEQWDCGDCRSAFESATDEFLDGLDELFDDFEDKW